MHANSPISKDRRIGQGAHGTTFKSKTKQMTIDDELSNIMHHVEDQPFGQENMYSHASPKPRCSVINPSRITGHKNPMTLLQYDGELSDDEHQKYCRYLTSSSNVSLSTDTVRSTDGKRGRSQQHEASATDSKVAISYNQSNAPTTLQPSFPAPTLTHMFGQGSILKNCNINHCGKADVRTIGGYLTIIRNPISPKHQYSETPLVRKRLHYNCK